MIEQTIGIVVIGWLVCRLAAAIIIHFRASVYDFMEVRQKSKMFRHRPLISVIIPTRNSEQSIKACLESVRQGSYRKHEIIVIDNASRDKTKQIIRDHIASHPKQRIRLVARRTDNVRDITAAQKYVGGELIMVLDPKSTLAKDALHRAVHHFSVNNSTNTLLVNNRLITDYLSTVTLLQQFEYLLTARMRKSGYFFDSPPANQNSRICRREVMDYHQQLAVRDSADFYAHDVVIYSRAANSYKQLLFDYSKTRLLSIIVVFLDGIAFSYLAYLAISFHSTTLFVISWVGLCVMLFAAIWSDEHMSMRGKTHLSLLVPTGYSLFLLQTILKLLALGKAMFSRSAPQHSK